MSLHVRFAIISDLHIGLPHTIWDHPSRFHLVEVSIPALETALAHLTPLDLDFLLLPGDLTQHGERENHEWLRDRLTQLPFPTYVIPGNHDIVTPQAEAQRIGPEEFPQLYQQFGYADARGCGDRRDYYSVSPVPGLRLMGLNSNRFDDEGQIIGRLDKAQFDWLEAELTQAQAQGERVFIMIHHNVIEHIPNQANHPMGRRYILQNAGRLRSLLKAFQVSLIFTGHLHVQDVSQDDTLYEITTGSLVSYPHPYRILEFEETEGQARLSYTSHRVSAVAGWPDLQGRSRQWMGDRSQSFMEKLLMGPPTHLPQALATQLAPSLRNFWADIAEGDRTFSFEQLPDHWQGIPLRAYLESFGAIAGTIDNAATLDLPQLDFSPSAFICSR